MHKERMQSMVLQKEPILYIKQLSKQYGERVILRDITMNIYPCEVVSLIGASGSGKSTLLRCINQLETKLPGKFILKENVWAARGSIWPSTERGLEWCFSISTCSIT